MQSQTDAEAVLRILSTAAIDLVPGCSCAAISRIHGRRVLSMVPTDSIAAELDQLQSDLGEGAGAQQPSRAQNRAHQRPGRRTTMAQHAAVAMAGAAAEEQMHSAVASRDIIGQSKGILMRRDNLTGTASIRHAHPCVAGEQRQTGRRLPDGSLPNTKRASAGA
jgi:hypothetical protein